MLKKEEMTMPDLMVTMMTLVMMMIVKMERAAMS